MSLREGMVDLAVQDNFDASLFRTYDIRGQVGEHGLTPKLAYAIGRAIAAQAREQNQKAIIVGRDGRLSGPALTEAFIAGLRDSGLDVIFIGLVPTPLLYFATHRLTTRSGVMVPASHNPADHNGFKIVLNGKTLTTDGVQAIYHRICERRFVNGKGSFTETSIVDDYTSYVISQVQLARPLKVVVDCGNGVAVVLAPNLYRAMGCEIEEL